MDAEEVFDGIQHTFMINTLNNVGSETSFFNLTRGICTAKKQTKIPLLTS